MGFCIVRGYPLSPFPSSVLFFFFLWLSCHLKTPFFFLPLTSFFFFVSLFHPFFSLIRLLAIMFSWETDIQARKKKKKRNEWLTWPSFSLFVYFFFFTLFFFFATLGKKLFSLNRVVAQRERERERRTPLSVLTALLFSFIIIILLRTFPCVFKCAWICIWMLLLYTFFFFLEPTDSLFRVPCPQHRNQRSQPSRIMDCLFLFFSFLLQCLFSWGPTACCCISLSPSIESSVHVSLSFFFFFCVPFSFLANDLLRQ